MANKQLITIAGSAVAVALVGVAVWFLFLRPETATQAPSNSGFGVGDNRTVTVTTGADNTNSNQPAESAQITQQIIFKIADGPIAGATLIETVRPTTTIARYIKQDNGHVFDLVLDSPGTIPRALSNTTIPGVFRAVWLEQGGAAVLQYMSGDII